MFRSLICVNLAVPNALAKSKLAYIFRSKPFYVSCCEYKIHKLQSDRFCLEISQMLLSINSRYAFRLFIFIALSTVTISPSGPIQGAMVGSPQVINCTVSTISEIEFSSVMINWMGPGGAITATNGRVSIGSVTDDGNNMYTSSLQFTYLMEGDEGMYTCNVMILDTSGSQSVEIQSLTSKLKNTYICTLCSLLFCTVPTPIVKVTALNSTQTVGQSLTLQCEVTTVRGITSRVDIVWRRNDTIINSTRVTAVGSSPVYRNFYTISQLNTSHDGEMYECRSIIRTRPRIRVIDIYTVRLDTNG